MITVILALGAIYMLASAFFYKPTNNHKNGKQE